MFGSKQLSMKKNALLQKSYKFVKGGFPLLGWLPQYNAEKAVSDLVAGISIGLTLIPQVIAYSALAGLTPQFGLYSSLFGGLIYVIFGTTPELNIVPTAIISLLTFSYTHNSPIGPVKSAVLLCFLSGLIELASGLLRLGFLVDFISTPVVAAFTSAAAITIASSQVKDILGLEFAAENFLSVMINVFKHIEETRLNDLTLGVICCVFLIGLKDCGSRSGEDGKASRWQTILWFISASRNALIVVGCALLAYVFEINRMKPFTLTAKVPAGLPPFAIPDFEVTTQNRTYSFIEITSHYGLGLFVLPFVSILGNVAICKAFSRGKPVDASQEMVAVGMCNIVGSLFSGFPVNAAFSLAAVGSASGIRTSAAGVYGSGMVLLALTFLTPYFSYIPRPTLAAVVICAVIFMVEVTATKLIWNIHKLDVIPFSITFLTCLGFGIEVGIVIGIFIDIILLLYYSARPKVLVDVVTEHGVEYTKITPTSSILYPSAEYIREIILKAAKPHKVFVIDCTKMNRADYTAAKCIGTLIAELNGDGKIVVFFGLERTAAGVIIGSCSQTCFTVKTEEELQELLRKINTDFGLVLSNVPRLQEHRASDSYRVVTIDR